MFVCNSDLNASHEIELAAVTVHPRYVVILNNVNSRNATGGGGNKRAALNSQMPYIDRYAPLLAVGVRAFFCSRLQYNSTSVA
jgi:hypothetical protein